MRVDRSNREKKATPPKSRHFDATFEIFGGPPRLERLHPVKVSLRNYIVDLGRLIEPCMSCILIAIERLLYLCYSIDRDKCYWVGKRNGVV